MRAFLERIEKEWLDDFIYISRQPLIDRGFEVIPFDGTDIKRSLLAREDLNSKTDIIVGSVEATVGFFKAVGIQVPNYLGYPDQLEKYLGRKVWKSRLNEITCELPYFIKPATEVKKFTGVLVEKASSLDFLKKYDNLNDEDLLYVSEPIDIKSEYRCFVHNKTLKGVQHYSGDFRLYPDMEKVESMIRDYTESKIAYTLDVGVLDDKSTVLVEVNDMWAIGSYGLSGKIYTDMIVDRFRQIVNESVSEKLSE